MSYATGLRLLAAFCCFTVVLFPLGILFWIQARKKEKAADRQQEAIERLAEEQ